MAAKEVQSTWIRELRQGDSIAAQRLWDAYFPQLVTRAHTRLQQISPDRGADDIALSALRSVMVGIQAGKYEAIQDCSSLWRLLVVITANKSVDEIRRQKALKRAVSATCQLADIEQIIGSEPRPEFAVEVADVMEDLLHRLGDKSLKTIASMKLEGYSNGEIAQAIGRSTKSVQRKLKRIRLEFEHLGAEGHSTTQDSE